MKFGVQEWNKIESQIRPERQSALFALALFLAQREEINDRDTRKSGGTSNSDMARSSGRLQEPLPGFDLATV